MIDIIGRNIVNLKFKSFRNVNGFIRLIPFVWIFLHFKNEH